MGTDAWGELHVTMETDKPSKAKTASNYQKLGEKHRKILPQRLWEEPNLPTPCLQSADL